MRYIRFILLLPFILSCNQKGERSITEQETAGTIQKYIPPKPSSARSLWEVTDYKYKQKLTTLLSLNPLENGSDSFELRFWSVGSIYDPIVLYILKKQRNMSWSNLHYQIYRGATWNKGDPEIDSLSVERVWPRSMTWEKYIGTLDLDSLWSTPSQREVVDDSFGGVDGYTYFIELSDSKRYRFLSYYVPDRLKDEEPHHRRVWKFVQALSDGILYNGIKNP